MAGKYEPRRGPGRNARQALPPEDLEHKGEDSQVYRRMRTPLNLGSGQRCSQISASKGWIGTKSSRDTETSELSDQSELGYLEAQSIFPQDLERRQCGLGDACVPPLRSALAAAHRPARPRPPPRPAPAPPRLIGAGFRGRAGRGGGSVRSCKSRFRGGPEEVRAVEAGRPAVVGGAVR